MKSIRNLYKVGMGPSSSHTMGPAYAAAQFLSEHRDADLIQVVLYGPLAKTGEDLSHLYRETAEGGLAKMYNT